VIETEGVERVRPIARWPLWRGAGRISKVTPGGMESGAPPMLDCGWSVVLKVRVVVRRAEVRVAGVGRLRRGSEQAIVDYYLALCTAGCRCPKMLGLVGGRSCLLYHRDVFCKIVVGEGG